MIRRLKKRKRQAREREKLRKRRLRNPDYYKKYYALNREKIAEIGRQARLKNKEKDERNFT